MSNRGTWRSLSLNTVLDDASADIKAVGVGDLVGASWFGHEHNVP
jgi:hypothetical protein